LKEAGYERTERESPFSDDGELWTNSYELVCDETAIVIRKDRATRSQEDDEERVYTYRNSDKVKLYGGYVSSYDWGESESGDFVYVRK